MLVLFVVSKFQETGTLFGLAGELIKAGNRVQFLFIQEGCYHSADKDLIKALDLTDGLYALREDCIALGIIDDAAELVRTIDYCDWVELLEACDRVVSWT